MISISVSDSSLSARRAAAQNASRNASSLSSVTETPAAIACPPPRTMCSRQMSMASTSEKPAMLQTYRMELGDKGIAVKNVFVPLFINGRRWGNFEYAYRDE